MQTLFADICLQVKAIPTTTLVDVAGQRLLVNRLARQTTDSLADDGTSIRVRNE